MFLTPSPWCHHFGQHIPPALEGEGGVDTKLKLRLVSMSIGYVYLDLFEVLINARCGGRILSVKQQLEGLLKELEDKPLAEYFEGTVAKHVYYISDFLCRAGEKEKERRTKNNDVGACIGAVSRHFVTKASEIEAVKRGICPII
jgi:hypothetical protein